LEDALAEMNQQMDDLKADLAAEKSRLQRDNGRLQNLVSEINLKRTAEVDSFKSELARLEVETEEEIQAAKDQVISMKQDLELLNQACLSWLYDRQELMNRTRRLLLDLYGNSSASSLLRWTPMTICLPK
jgi:chromosome segregation ATPase